MLRSKYEGAGDRRAGYIGSHTCLELLMDGHDVVSSTIFQIVIPLSLTVSNAFADSARFFYREDVCNNKKGGRNPCRTPR